MKNIFKILAISLIFGLLIGISTASLAQPNPPNDHGQEANQPGGAAPVGSGLLLMLGMGAAYGGRKLFKARRRLEE